MSSSLLTFADNINTFPKFLKIYNEAEEGNVDFDQQIKPRILKDTHGYFVQPEPPESAFIVASSEHCAQLLGLDVAELKKQEFLDLFSGKKLVSGLESPYASVYGCHCYGTYFDQLGDGRAMSIGEVFVKKNSNILDEEIYELQLKGAGRTPFSRGFDGKAVLRSSLREFLASESMHHLGVGTTRALSLIGTSENIRRPWYPVDSTNVMVTVSEDEKLVKYPPNAMTVEKGAIMCRVSRSFIRFGQIELFAKRKEYENLQRLLDYACLREYPELLQPTDIVEDEGKIKSGNLMRYVNLFRKIAENCAELVTNWIRVGFVQGNMNSDNTLVGGRTLDYGPFGFVEKYDALYQPFTSDQDGKFAFMRQPTAMHVNLLVLSEAFEELLKYRGETLGLSEEEISKHLTLIDTIAKKEFPAIFADKFADMRRRKMGLYQWREGSDDNLYMELDKLMYSTGAKSATIGVDYTIFWRLLSQVTSSSDVNEALSTLHPAFLLDASVDVDSPVESQMLKSGVDTEAWYTWLNLYITRVKEQELSGTFTSQEREDLMHKTNPKYIPRNYILTLCYEEAQKGSYNMLEELMEVLTHPYDEQSDEIASKYFQKEPQWARKMPGVKFMS